MGSNFCSSFECEGGSHVKHMHVVSLLIHPNFSSNLMVTCLDLFENSLLIHFQTVRNLVFDPVRTNEGGPKTKFRTLLNHVIMKSSKSREIWVEQKRNGMHMLHVTISFTFKTGSKVGAPRTKF